MKNFIGPFSMFGSISAKIASWLFAVGFSAVLSLIPAPIEGQTFHRVQISNDADDGYYNYDDGSGWHSSPQAGGADWVGSNSSTAHAWGIGYRFPATGIAQGETIRSAYIEVFSSDGFASGTACGYTPCTSSSSSFRVYGVLQPNAGPFDGSTGNKPFDVPYTTNSVDYTTTGPGDTPGSCLGTSNYGQNTCTHIIDVTSIVQEITSQPGWTTSSAIRFALVATSTTSGNVYAGFEDSSANPGRAATLIVNPPVPTVISTGSWGSNASSSGYPTQHQLGPFAYQGASTLLFFLADYYDDTTFGNGTLTIPQPSVTDTCGNTWSILDGPSDWAGLSYDQRSTVYYVQNPKPCQNGDEIDVTSSVGEPIFAHFIAVAGSDTSAPPAKSGITNPAGTASSTATTNPVSLGSPGLLVSWIFGNSDGVSHINYVFTPQSGFTSDINLLPNYLTAAYENVSSGTYTNTFSISFSGASSADGWQAELVGLSASGGSSGKSNPMISAWPTASAISYGQTLASSTLSGGTASVGGSFAFTNPSTTPSAGTYAASVLFTPSDTTSYNTVSGTVNVTVNKASPLVSAWPTASAISYGQTLASSTLTGGTASVGGSFAFTAPGTTPGATGPYSASVTFTPSDTTDYASISGTVTVNVTQGNLTVTAWPTASAIAYGQSLASSTLTGGTASIGGSFAFTAPGTTPGATGPYSASVTFTPTDTTDYGSVTGTVSVTVNKASPTVSAWPAASAISYGQTLASSTLTGGTVSVGGSFAFTTPSTTPGAAGPYSASVTFTPSDNTDYVAVTGTVNVVVNKGTPVLTWSAPAPISYGTALGSAQLDASSTVSGSFVYSPLAGTVLNAGTQVLSVTFTPTDTTNYTANTQTASLLVNKASQMISFSLPSTIVYGAAPIPLTATGGASGNPVTFTVLSGPGLISANKLAISGAGTIVVGANQVGNANFQDAAQVTQSIVIAGNTLTVTANNASRVYGTANPVFTGTIMGAQNGDTFNESFSTAATINSNVGTYPIVPLATGANIAAYLLTTQNGILTVTQAGTTTSLSASSSSLTAGQSITLSANVSSLTTGIPTGAVGFFDGSAQLGTAVLSSGVASLSIASLSSGAHSITALYTGDANFAGSTSTSTAISIGGSDFSLTDAGPPTQTIPPGGTGTYQLALVPPGNGTYPGTITFSISGLPVGAIHTFSPSSVASGAGPQTVTVTIQTSASVGRMLNGDFARRVGGLALAFVFLPLLAGRRLRLMGRRLRTEIMMLLLLGAMGISAIGCASTRTTMKSYNVTITASGGGVQHSTNVTLDLQ